MLRKISIILSILVLVYLATGLAFHFKWKSELAACREARRARGEFVEPEVFGGVLSLIFDVAYWPVYSWANIYHFGTPFATPCVCPSSGLSSEVEVSHARFGVGRGPLVPAQPQERLSTSSVEHPVSFQIVTLAGRNYSAVLPQCLYG